MARIRTIKPEFWTDERIGECSFIARLFFIATWNFADDHGGLERSPKQLKAQAFPYDNIDCEPLIKELLHAGVLIEYEVGGKKYLHIKGFRKHQRNEKPAAPRVPLYVDNIAVAQSVPTVIHGEISPSVGGTVTTVGGTDASIGKRHPSDGSSLGLESKGREGNVIPECARDSGIGQDGDSAKRGQIERVKQVYPKGIYAQSDWLIAEREARRRIDEGHTWSELIAGCQRYALQCVAKGSIGTQFVESPKKFFALPECKFQDPFPLPTVARKSNPGEKTKEQRDAEDSARMRELMDSRGVRGIPNFRDPYPVESPSAYETALRLEVTHGQHDTSAVQALAASKRMKL